MRVTRHPAAMLLIWATLACAPPPTDLDAADAGETDASEDGDAGLLASDTVFNAWAQASSVWPGALVGVELFFSPEPVGAWHLSVLDVVGGRVELGDSVMDATRPRVRARVEVDPAATGSVQFVARATQGDDVREATVELWLLQGEGVEGGFEVYSEPDAEVVPAGDEAGFRVRVVSYGGFVGTVNLLAGGAIEGLLSTLLDQAEVAVAPGVVGETRLQVKALPNAETIGAVVWGAHGRTVKVAATSTSALVGTPASPVYGLNLPHRLYVSRGQSRAFARSLVRSGRFSPLDATFELVSPPAGVSLEADGLHVAAEATPGVYELELIGRGAQGEEASGVVRLIVPGDPPGWSLVGGVLPSPAVEAQGLFANGRGPIEVPGSGGRLRFDGESWKWFAEDASRFSTRSRGSVRLEGRQAPNRLVSLSEVDTDPSGFGTRFWQAGESGSGARAPSVAVDGQGETWMAFESQSFATAVYRRGTVPCGVPVTDGLPAVTSIRPLIAAAGSTVVLAQPAGDVVALSGFDRGTGRWSALPALEVQLADGDVRLLALDVDGEGRAVLGWVGMDEAIHVARLAAGVWSQVTRFTPSENTIALSLDLRVGTDGLITVAWLEAGHALVPGAWPASATRTKLRFARGDAIWTETALAAFDPTASVGVPAFDLDAGGSLVVAFPEDGALVIMRGD